MTLKRTLVDRVFEAIPLNTDGGVEAMTLDTLQQQHFPELRADALYSPLYSLAKEGSIRKLGADSTHGAARYMREVTTRQKREYSPKQRTAFRPRESTRNPVVLDAFKQAEQRYGKLELREAMATTEPLTSAAEAVAEFGKAVVTLEARVHRLLQDNEQLRQERDHYRAVLKELAGRIHAVDPDNHGD